MVMATSGGRLSSDDEDAKYSGTIERFPLHAMRIIDERRKDHQNCRVRVSGTEMSDIYRAYRGRLKMFYWSSEDNDRVCKSAMDLLDQIIICRGSEPSTVINYVALVREVYSHICINLKQQTLRPQQRLEKMTEHWEQIKRHFIKIKYAMIDCWPQGNEPDLMSVYVSMALLYSLYKSVCDESIIGHCYQAAQRARELGSRNITESEWSEVDQYCETIENIFFLRRQRSGSDGLSVGMSSSVLATDVRMLNGSSNPKIIDEGPAILAEYGKLTSGPVGGATRSQANAGYDSNIVTEKSVSGKYRDDALIWHDEESYRPTNGSFESKSLSYETATSSSSFSDSAEATYLASDGHQTAAHDSSSKDKILDYQSLQSNNTKLKYVDDSDAEQPTTNDQSIIDQPKPSNQSSDQAATADQHRVLSEKNFMTHKFSDTAVKEVRYKRWNFDERIIEHYAEMDLDHEPSKDLDKPRVVFQSVDTNDRRAHNIDRSPNKLPAATFSKLPLEQQSTDRASNQKDRIRIRAQNQYGTQPVASTSKQPQQQSSSKPISSESIDVRSSTKRFSVPIDHDRSASSQKQNETLNQSAEWMITDLQRNSANGTTIMLDEGFKHSSNKNPPTIRTPRSTTFDGQYGKSSDTVAVRDNFIENYFTDQSTSLDAGQHLLCYTRDLPKCTMVSVNRALRAKQRKLSGLDETINFSSSRRDSELSSNSSHRVSFTDAPLQTLLRAQDTPYLTITPAYIQSLLTDSAKFRMDIQRPRHQIQSGDQSAETRNISELDEASGRSETHSDRVVRRPVNVIRSERRNIDAKVTNRIAVLHPETQSEEQQEKQQQKSNMEASMTGYRPVITVLEITSIGAEKTNTSKRVINSDVQNGQLISGLTAVKGDDSSDSNLRGSILTESDGNNDSLSRDLHSGVTSVTSSESEVPLKMDFFDAKQEFELRLSRNRSRPKLELPVIVSSTLKKNAPAAVNVGKTVHVRTTTAGSSIGGRSNLGHGSVQKPNFDFLIKKDENNGDITY